MVTGGFRTAEGMAAAITSGAVDMVGLARILAIEPDVAKRVLAGKAPLQKVKPITTGIKAIDKLGILEVSWYTGQLKRIGRGEAPKPNESGLWVFIKQVWHMARAGKKKTGPARVRAN